MYNSTFSIRTYYYICLIGILILYKNKLKDNLDYNLFLNILVYALGIKLIFCNYSTISNRLFENFYIVSIFIIPLFAEKIKQKKISKFVIIFLNFILYINFVCNTLNYYNIFL